MKRIDVTGGYYIDIDDRNWTLKSNIKEYTDSEGNIKESFTLHGYFGNLENAMLSNWKN